MSQETVTKVILKAMSEDEFRENLFANPGTVLTGFDLTEEERQALSNVQRESFDAFASEIEQRISKTFLAFPFDRPHRSMPEEPLPIIPINLPGPVS